MAKTSYRKERKKNHIAMTAPLLTGASLLLLETLPLPAFAANLYDGSNAGSNLEINLTTTVSYTGLYRVNAPSPLLDGESEIAPPGIPTGAPFPQTNINGNDGDRNFRHGIVGNLFEAVPVLDIRDGDYGAHVSGQLYINTPYLGTNQNDFASSNNAIYNAKNTDFTSATRNVDGENAQLLDAFVFGGHTFDDGQAAQVKVGRQTLFWGQSLFFPTDGISGGQAPINVVSAQNSINPQAQQVFMPVGQAVVTYEPVAGTTIQAYYQFEWEHDYFQGQGAYFNPADYIDKGASTLILPPAFAAALGGEFEALEHFYPFPPDTAVDFARTKDIDPEHQNGQFGFSVQQELGNWDLGAYVERFDAKAPQIYASPFVGLDKVLPNGVQGGTYTVVYPRDIWLQGVSFSTNIGPTNVAGEFSVREHDPLLPNTFCIAGTPGVKGSAANANGSQLCPTGTVWDAQLSELYITPGIPLDPGGVSILGEVIVNHLIRTTNNRAILRPYGQATAAAFDLSVTPTYNDVLPNLQLLFPIGLTYDFLGRSQVDSSLQHGDGTFDAGVTAIYKVNWNVSLAYQDYIGKPSISAQDTTYNSLADHGFLSLNLQHTF
jgi:hypothetical protein